MESTNERRKCNTYKADWEVFGTTLRQINITEEMTANQVAEELQKRSEMACEKAIPHKKANKDFKNETTGENKNKQKEVPKRQIFNCSRRV